jgi:hypothetical protein
MIYKSEIWGIDDTMNTHSIEIGTIFQKGNTAKNKAIHHIIKTTNCIDQ